MRIFQLSLAASPIRAFRAAFFTACAVFACVVSAANASNLEVLVPAYFYPDTGGGLWNDLNTAAASVPITAILNPASGPGNSIDSNYVSAVNALRAAGGRVIAYVPSGYGLRPMADVQADIDTYASWYNIDGIFIDEMSDIPSAGVLQYYGAIYDYIKAADPTWEVIGNPGTNTEEAFLTHPTADRLVVIEEAATGYAANSPDAWNFNYTPEHFVHLAHTTPDATTMESFVDLAVSRNAGMVYFTDDVLDNPWDSLPSYWLEELAAIAAYNALNAPKADFDADGDVDGDDFLAWQIGNGTTGGASLSGGDANGDSNVNADDFSIWESQFGSTSSPGGLAASSAVPEPGTLALCIVAIVTTIAMRRRTN